MWVLIVIFSMNAAPVVVTDIRTKDICEHMRQDILAKADQRWSMSNREAIISGCYWRT
jgi:hypothetical protein